MNNHEHIDIKCEEMTGETGDKGLTTELLQRRKKFSTSTQMNGRVD